MNSLSDWIRDFAAEKLWRVADYSPGNMSLQSHDP